MRQTRVFRDRNGRRSAAFGGVAGARSWPRGVAGSVTADVWPRLGLARHSVAVCGPGVTLPQGRDNARGARVVFPWALLGPSRCDFDPFVVLTSRRDNGNGAQGRGDSPRALGELSSMSFGVASRFSRQEVAIIRPRGKRTPRAGNPLCGDAADLVRRISGELKASHSTDGAIGECTETYVSYAVR